MFTKEGIPFFTIIMPFLFVIFISFFSTSYYLKLSDENFYEDLNQYKEIYKNQNKTKQEIKRITNDLINKHKNRQKRFKNFMMLLTQIVVITIAIFSFLMVSIINDLVKKYKMQVLNKEQKLEKLNSTLAQKVNFGIEEAKRKDKTILEQSRLARMGTMLSMIAHQWRQPLTQLSVILMELEVATRLKKVNDKHILDSVEKSDKMIEFMSNTIDDFRNFYKPNKKKEHFYVMDACNKAINLINATLKHNSTKLNIENKNDKLIYGYASEYSQVILNLLSNASDILIERKIKNAKIDLIIESTNDSSIVTIKDNAGGIKEDNLDLVFDPYYTTKDSSKGTGLGLYISKLIIEKNMHGHLEVSNSSEGAVFKISIMDEKNG
ncbi:histidine kinase [Malaciobacter molluscorum LMG 25693]|uniref:histidine kinase n=1 Tax=Malaciobacter molluscorum LMG 25693 TaxID=870501 RepID=A0A2G1DII3_9BACT|nr:HAMP domain-containing sensor histidine kinase [Malaciobacter molluscorum]AXX91894.1 two-component system sensor histidine kinase [Malaciobacter molluscorum LMG 25693]PHO18297.1 histidine kinase [Malaciobacter molluscorum LMG 25693]